MHVVWQPQIIVAAIQYKVVRRLFFFFCESFLSPFLEGIFNFWMDNLMGVQTVLISVVMVKCMYRGVCVCVCASAWCVACMYSGVCVCCCIIYIMTYSRNVFKCYFRTLVFKCMATRTLVTLSASGPSTWRTLSWLWTQRWREARWAVCYTYTAISLSFVTLV